RLPFACGLPLEAHNGRESLRFAQGAFSTMLEGLTTPYIHSIYTSSTSTTVQGLQPQPRNTYVYRVLRTPYNWDNGVLARTFPSIAGRLGLSCGRKPPTNFAPSS